MTNADGAADLHRENMKKKRREMEQASIDAASDLLDTDSNATFAMVRTHRRVAINLVSHRFSVVSFDCAETIGSPSGRSVGIRETKTM